MLRYHIISGLWLVMIIIRTHIISYLFSVLPSHVRCHIIIIVLLVMMLNGIFPGGDECYNDKINDHDMSIGNWSSNPSGAGLCKFLGGYLLLILLPLLYLVCIGHVNHSWLSYALVPSPTPPSVLLVVVSLYFGNDMMDIRWATQQ